SDGPRGGGSRPRPDGPDPQTTPADPREISIAREIIAAGQDEPRRRQDARRDRDEGASLHMRCFAQGEAKAIWGFLRAQLFGLRDPHHETRAYAAQIHLLDRAGE